MRPMRTFRWPLLLALLLTVTGAAAGQAARLGSADWFHRMRETSADQDLLRALGASSPEQVPPGYVEIAGLIRILPQSSFADGNLPNLHILCAQPCSDPVVRKPQVTMEGKRLGEFYTVLKSGQKYKFDLTVFFIHNVIGTWTVPDDAPGQMRLGLTLGRPGAARIASFRSLQNGLPGSMQDASRSELDAGLDALDAVPPPDPVYPIALNRALAYSRALGFSGSRLPPLPGDLRKIAGEMRSLPVQGPEATAARARPVLAAREVASADPNQFDLRGLSTPPTDARHAALWKQILAATTPEQKAKAHQALAAWYRSRGDADQAAQETQRARYWAGTVQREP